LNTICAPIAHGLTGRTFELAFYVTLGPISLVISAMVLDGINRLSQEFINHENLNSCVMASKKTSIKRENNNHHSINYSY
jgi:hypothetical protein